MKTFADRRTHSWKWRADEIRKAAAKKQKIWKASGHPGRQLIEQCRICRRSVPWYHMCPQRVCWRHKHNHGLCRKHLVLVDAQDVILYTQSELRSGVSAKIACCPGCQARLFRGGRTLLLCNKCGGMFDINKQTMRLEIFCWEELETSSEWSAEEVNYTSSDLI